MRKTDSEAAGHAHYKSLHDFLEATPRAAGDFTVMHNGLPIDVRYEPRGRDATIVFFHAAISRETARLPMFLGAGISETLPADRIFIADPSMYMDTEQTLAWYAGNRHQPNLQDVITQILAALIPSGRRVAMYGGSGGGFAAMYYSARISNSIAVPVNPQVDLAAHTPAVVEKWLRLAWGAGTELSELPVEIDAGRAYREGGSARLWYIQNTGDKRHIRRHFEPFMASLPARHHVSPLLVDAGPGHVRPGKRLLTAVLGAAVEEYRVPPNRADLAVYQ